MNFSSYGTSGSDYTLVVSPHTNQNAITLNNTQETPFLLDIRLFDNKNEQMSLNNVSVSVSIINSDNSKLIAETTETKDGCKVYLKAPLENEDSSTDKYGVLADILEVSVSGIAADVGTLTTLYPIAYSANTAGYIEGASTVIYDSNGGSPSYYKDPYKYFTQLGEQKNITWELCFTPTPGDNENIDHIKACMPTL
jgi:flagellar basal body rod protein FlgC